MNAILYAPGRLALVFAFGIAALCVAPAGRADTAKGEDDKYRKAIDAAVDAGLEFLAKSQLADGSFTGQPRCNAVTSLSIMAFLARGYSPGLEPYGDTINRGIDSVLGTLQPDGTLIGPGGGQMYSHNIASLMLSEVSGMVDPERQKRIDEVLPKALRVILAAQKVGKSEKMQGGWRYNPNSNDSDMSHSGWAMMALRSARNNGTAVPKEAIDDALKFIRNCACLGGGFGYTPGAAQSLGLSGAGLLCLELSGQHRTENNLRTGQYIMNQFQSSAPGGYYYYSIYYLSQSMFQLGEKEWQEFAPLLYESILKLQAPDGSWQPAQVWSNENAGASYRTAMALLALSVSYRQLPIYQR